ncbi:MULTISPECIES: hypothetical protein [Streptomyces]|uniref:HTTM-like domain-containing protein n=1 Tax=Streptomyces dengpaensis TaxID=2049881 RepID=A0ABN5HZ81_9ACTN|nr:MULTISPECIES: hypothetical protein [Streptomyces]AVH55861.1 hypothetical protein C4B68_08855 [Streptomyces dengpaensis]PIB12112.1 hypothetical protein B1C81_02790 [Streptomyces sp. HG99]
MNGLESAVVLSSALAATGMVIETGELLAGRRFVLDRAFNWPLIETRYYILAHRPRTRAVFRAVFGSRRTVPLLVAAHAVAAVGYPLAITTAAPLAAACGLFVLTVHLMLHLRFLVGMDGADQMQTVLWAGLFVYSLTDDERVRLAAVSFVVAQLLLSYIVAGVAKAASPTWRSGRAVALIVRTQGYGVRGARELLSVPLISAAACWATIAFELGAPVLFALTALTAPALVVLIASGILFHLSIALVMGLPSFIWSFLGTYPLLWALPYATGLVR